MLNQTILVGRIATLPVNKDNEYNFITVAVPNNFKNANGEYDVNMIDCRLQGSLIDNTLEHCRVGDVIGIKGRLASNKGLLQLITERVSFLSSNKSE